MDERRLAQMVPDANFRRQLEVRIFHTFPHILHGAHLVPQGFFNGNAGLAGRFPGGILQFAQAIAQLPPDVLEDMMMAEAMGGGGVELAGLADVGGMPGGLDIEDLNPQEPIALGVLAPPAPHNGRGPVEDRWEEEARGDEDVADEDEDEEEDEEDISVRTRLDCWEPGADTVRCIADASGATKYPGPLLGPCTCRRGLILGRRTGTAG